MTKQYGYYAFGNEMNKVDSDTNPFRYCGEYYDREIDKVYLRARYYTPIQGRFMTEDPIKDGLNWYAYCGNEPMMMWDPTGMLREGYTDENGVYHADPDAEEFGKDSIFYSSLVTLGEMWQLREYNRGDIQELANVVREIGRKMGINTIIDVVKKVAPASANDTDIIIIIIMAGYSMKSAEAFLDKKTAEKYADEIYGIDSDGSQHNALKHTMWSALLTKNYGNDYARIITNSHEFGAKENLNPDLNQQSLMNMDIYNNSIGRTIGSTFKKSSFIANYEKELAYKIAAMIDNGQLMVVNWGE